MDPCDRMDSRTLAWSLSPIAVNSTRSHGFSDPDAASPHDRIYGKTIRMALRISVVQGIGCFTVLVAGCASPAPKPPDRPPSAAKTMERADSEPPLVHPACVAPSSPTTAVYGTDDFPSARCRARAADLLSKMPPRE